MGEAWWTDRPDYVGLCAVCNLHVFRQPPRLGADNAPLCERCQAKPGIVWTFLHAPEPVGHTDLARFNERYSALSREALARLVADPRINPFAVRYYRAISFDSTTVVVAVVPTSGGEASDA